MNGFAGKRRSDLLRRVEEVMAAAEARLASKRATFALPEKRESCESQEACSFP